MIHFSDISKQYGTKVLYQNANFLIRPDDKIGLVGPNGAGKTTIFKIITKEEGFDSGTLVVPEKMIIGYFSQNIGEMHGKTVLEEVKDGAGKVSDIGKELSEIETKLQDPELDPDEMTKILERYGEIQLEFENRGGYDIESRAKEILGGLGFANEEFNRPVESYSGGWKMRIALAKILLLSPDLLLMDEPTNHLDLESIEWLESWLNQFKGALVMTSHDREFMNRLCSRTIEIANKAVTVYSGNYEFYLKEREIRKEQLLAAHRKQQEMLAKEEDFIARFAARASHAAQVQSRVKKLEKIERIEIPNEERVMQFEFPQAPRSGNDVVKLNNLTHSFLLENGSTKTVLKNLNGIVRRLDKVAVVGINGAGKSTLLKIIVGQLQPTQGEGSMGANVKVGYFSQHALEVLNPNKTIFDEIHDRIPEATIGLVRNLLGAFLFSGDDVYKKIGILSGGEKSRVVLATLLAQPLNLLILDEPTNHLDIQSREMLLEALKQFDGTILFVSHDRYFLKHLATRVFHIAEGGLHSFDGTYEEYLASSQHAEHR